MGLIAAKRAGFFRNERTSRRHPSWGLMSGGLRTNIPIATFAIQLRPDGLFDYAFSIGRFRNGICKRQGVAHSLSQAVYIATHFNL